MKKEGKIKTAKVTREEQLNYCRGIREDKFMKRQKLGLAVPNSYIMKPAKSLVPDKYNNQMELKKLKRIKYFTK